MEDELSRHQFLQRVWSGTIAVTTICVHYATFLMATNSGTISSPKAQWNDNEIAALLQYLDKQKSQSEGVGNFKDPIWNSAPEAIKDHHSRGPVKTAKMCRNKWTTVRCQLLIMMHATDLPPSFQLKGIYNSIEGYRSASGFHFDNVNGANIQGEAATGIWNDIVTKKVCCYASILIIP